MIGVPRDLVSGDRESQPLRAPVQMPELVGRRVRLRAFGAADISNAYIGWLNDPEVVRYSNQRFLRHNRSSCERYRASFAGTDNLFYSVQLSGRAIGTLTAYRSVQHGTADIGILMGERSVWGQGLGLDAFKTLADWLASRPGMRKLTAGMLACNEGMVRVAERAGFEVEAVRRAQEVVQGRAVDMLYCARFCSPPDEAS